MANKQEVKKFGHRIPEQRMAEFRLEAINIASRLPEPEPSGQGMMGGAYQRPGKSAAKVVADAAEIMAFILKQA